jgi:hypothetical protein
MHTAEDRLRFAVAFAGLDLGRLRAGDLLNLKDDLQGFLALEPVSVAGVLPYEYSTEQLRTLQQEVQQLLRDLVQQRQATGHWPLAHHTTPCRLDVEYHVTPLDGVGMKGRNLIRVRGPIRDVFLFVLIHLLWQEPTWRVAECPSCHTIFYRDRANQDYCTRRCVNRVNKRTWRQRRQPAPAPVGADAP